MRRPFALAALSLSLVACGASASGGLMGANEATGAPAPYYPPYGGGGGAAGGSGGVTPPPEKEVESSYLSPVATGHYVWVANPTSGRVAFIDATSLAIQVVEAGNGPTYLTAIPDGSRDTALVLNVLSHDATLLRADAGMLASVSLPVAAAANSWAVSPNGRFAIAWTDARKVSNPDPVQGFQDITLLDLTEGAEASFPLSVGYRPVDVVFDDGSSRAFVVTQDGIAIVDLGASPPAVTRNVHVTESKNETTATYDVGITKDGKFALVRRDGAMTITIASLDSDATIDVPLHAPATDLALAPSGNVAIAVLRSTGEALILHLPDVLGDPNATTSVQVGDTGNVVGSVRFAETTSLAFLFSNAVANPLLSVLDPTSSKPLPSTILLRAPVLGVFPTPDGSFAIVLHTTGPTGGGGGQASSYASAFSVVPVTNGLPPKIQGLAATPTSVAVAPDGAHALVAIGGDATNGPWAAYVASMPSLKIDEYPLASPPIAAGIVPTAGRGYVAQKHPDGRITFIDLATGDARTLTGFELASQVVYGSGG